MESTPFICSGRDSVCRPGGLWQRGESLLPQCWAFFHSERRRARSEDSRSALSGERVPVGRRFPTVTVVPLDEPNGGTQHD